jgi:hypothetical protein
MFLLPPSILPQNFLILPCSQELKFQHHRLYTIGVEHTQEKQEAGDIQSGHCFCLMQVFHSMPF